MKLAKFMVFLSLCLAISSFLHAAVISGGSTLLNQAYANQLESWLGEGAITLTRIFNKSIDGSSASAFHSSVDGKGRTFTVIHVSGGYNEIIGGYNPFSWDTRNNYHITTGRNAFIFNLTENRKFNQTGYHHPDYQTYNHVSYGPTFGTGHEIYVDGSLNSGYVYNHDPSNYPQGYHTYGSGGAYNLLGDPYGNYVNGVYQSSGPHAYSQSLVYGNIEVFTIQNGVVPEPTSWVMVAMTLLCLVFVSKKK